MQPDYRNTVIKRGYTSDIEKVVVSTFQKHWRECTEWAQQFRRSSERETCEAIFNWIVNNLIYEVDPPGEQRIQTPARLVIGTQKADCKSFSLLIASVLRCLNVPGHFRFVGFDGQNITHVYIVTNSGIIIDPVERPVRFNYARKFNINKDIDYMRDTLISVLSGLQEEYNEHFQDDKFFMDCTIAENYLYSEINLAMTDLKFARDEYEQRSCFDRLLLMFATLDSYQHAKGSNAKLKRLASIIQLFSDNGYLNYVLPELDETLLINQLDDVTGRIIELLSGNEIFEQQGTLTQWFDEQIIEHNRQVKVSQIQRENYIRAVFDAMPESRKVAGIGAVTNADKNELINRMRNSGAYFMYDLADTTFVNSLESNLIKSKRQYQNQARSSWNKDLSNAFNPQTIKNYVLTGYKESAQGQTPEETIKEGIQKFGNKESKIGDFGIVEAVLSIIAAIISILMSVFTLIKTIVSTFTGDTSNLSAGKANSYDYQGLGGYGGGGTGGGSNSIKETINKYSTDDPLGIGISTLGLVGTGAGVLVLALFLKKRR